MPRCLETRLAWIVALALVAGSVSAAEKVVWKPIEQAMLKIDDRPARVWNVYAADKKNQRLLVQLGRRFLVLDVPARQVFELAPEKLERNGRNLLWHETGDAGKPLPTAEWLIRDIGPARRIRAKLIEEGRILEVQVPIQPDRRAWY